jgi:hypothetical protein
LKKSESSGHKASGGDPETEQLISSTGDAPISGGESMSGDISNSSPILRPIRIDSVNKAPVSTKATPIKFVGIQSDDITFEAGLSKFSRRRPVPPLKSPPAIDDPGVAKCGHHLLGASGNPTCGCLPQTDYAIRPVQTSGRNISANSGEGGGDSPNEETKLLHTQRKRHDNDYNNS